MRSVVAGIIKPDGGFRVVVTDQPWTLRFHKHKGERLFIHPTLHPEIPVATDRAHEVIEPMRKYMLSQIAPVNRCGECQQCCKTLYINEDGLTKPSHQWCAHTCAEGCALYWKRPKPCQVFECLWLKSQQTEKPMAAELRPDRCHVVLTQDTSASIGKPVDPDLIEVHVDRDFPEALENQAIDEFLHDKKTKFITHYYGEQS